MRDWSAYDHPELLDTVSRRVSGGQREVVLAVDGVHCAACRRGVERSLATLASDIRLNLATRTLEFRFDPQRASFAEALGRLERDGYQPHPLVQDRDDDAVRQSRRAELARLGVAVICAMQVMMLAWPDYFDGGEVDRGIADLMRWSQWLLATPAVFYAGWPFLKSAAGDLRRRHLGMDVPVAASILIAYVASGWRTLAGSGALYFDAATMFVMLLGIGRYLEGRTRRLASARLGLLAGRQATVAHRIEGGRSHSVPITTLRPGDLLLVLPGESVPADGELLDADAELDESLLSGESRPVRKRQGDPLLAGSLNVGHAPLRLRTRTTGTGTRLAAITWLLRRAQADKPPAQRLADRIAGHFVLVVLLLAGSALLWWWPQEPARALNAMLAVLVVSCPCALSLAIPAVYAAASSRLSAGGVLLAQPSTLAVIPRLTHVLFDKTGTLTEPQLQLRELRRLGRLEESELRRIAAALERGLAHPIARALSADDAGAAVSGIELSANGGLRGQVDGLECWIGPPESVGLALPGEDALSWVALVVDGLPMALFGLSGALRPEAAATVEALRDQQLQLAIVSGDADQAVRGLATQLGIEATQARQSPEDKLASLRRLRATGAVVMAVGDGINDGPLLAAADVAVAMPGGAALAQARADVILTGNSLSGLLLLREVATAAQARVRENLAWALIYNLVMLPLAFSGLLTPWLAALGMSTSSLVVVGNALRLL